MSVRVTLDAVDLPGADACGHRGLRVGVQRQKDFEQLVDAGANLATFEFDVEVVADGDVRGPYVHGKRGDRFLYLAWVVRDGDAWSIVRRAKLHPHRLPDGVWDKAVASGELRGTVSLTDGKGEPLCSTIGHLVTWR